MKDRIRPGHPLSGSLGPDLSRPLSPSRTKHAMPVTPKQIAYARSLALRNRTLLPWEVQQDRRSLSAWIEAQARLKPVSDMDRLPTSKQVAFAEKLARIKRCAVPDECFRDKGLMSKWIDGNK